MFNNFNKWYADNFPHGNLDHRAGMKAAVDIMKSRLKRLEECPCSMSCYATMKELKGAIGMRKTALEILKQEESK